jgi:hypothetical protein
LDTAVIKIDSSCPAGNSDCAKKRAKEIDNGKPSPYAICASACAFVLAGGIQRYASALTQVGVHQPQSFTTYVRLRRVYRVTISPYGRKTKTLISESKVGQNTVRTETNERQYREMREFLAAMGIGALLFHSLDDTRRTSLNKVHNEPEHGFGASAKCGSTRDGTYLSADNRG